MADAEGVSCESEKLPELVEDRELDGDEDGEVDGEVDSERDGELDEEGEPPDGDDDSE